MQSDRRRACPSGERNPPLKNSSQTIAGFCGGDYFHGMRNIPVIVGICTFAVGAVVLSADEPVSSSPSAVSSIAASSAGTRHGLFNWLDRRSEYGQGAFPEPFLVDDSDFEDDEARLDWLHTRAGATTQDAATAEVEKGFGLVTLELEVPYERDSSEGTSSSLPS